jgi:hypothetical protein
MVLITMKLKLNVTGMSMPSVGGNHKATNITNLGTNWSITAALAW